MTITLTSDYPDVLKSVIRTTNVRIGAELKNGATLLMEKISQTHSPALETIVLAVHPGFQPFVTWRRIRNVAENPGPEQDGIVDFCIHGHYYRKLSDALKDFEERA